MGSVEEATASSAAAATAASLAAFPTAAFTGMDQSAPPVTSPTIKDPTPEQQLRSIYTEQQEQQKVVKKLEESFTRLETLLLNTLSSNAVPTGSVTEKEDQANPDPMEKAWPWDGHRNIQQTIPQTHQWSEEE